MNKQLRIGLVAVAGILLFGSLTQADWVQDNGSLNYDPAQAAATTSSLATNGVSPYVAWAETNPALTDVRVKQWNGASWVQLGGSLDLDVNRNADYPNLTVYNGTPYVAWAELVTSNTRGYIKNWNGASWVQLGAELNIDSGEYVYGPHLDVYNGTPYAAWAENLIGRQIYVKRWNGAAWVLIGGSLNVDVNASAYVPSLKVYNGTPFVAWHENVGAVTQVYVKRWNGASWLSNGGSLNVDVNRSAQSPSLGVYNGTPYVAWFEENASAVRQVYVKRWNGAAWLSNGGSLNVDVNRSADLPSLAFYNGTPYVAWREDSASANLVYVKQWNGASWVQIGSVLNVDTNRDAGWPSLNFANDTPYVSWQEPNASAVSQIYVKHYQSPTFTPTPSFTPTRSSTPTSTPTSTMTRTATPTPSRTMTPSATATYASPTQTGTISATLTATPSATATLTAISTATATATATRTATAAAPAPDLAGREVIAYPNPARKNMRFILNLEQSAVIKVEIYNAAGERVAALTETLSGPGAFLTWNCSDHARGAYYARVFKAGQEIATLKVALVK